jgi:hypothetical protein
MHALGGGHVRERFGHDQLAAGREVLREGRVVLETVGLLAG